MEDWNKMSALVEDLNEAAILEDMKIVGHRTPEERKLARAWADENGIEYNTRGKFPERVFFEYIKANHHKNQEVIASHTYRQRGKIYTTVEIWCVRCGTIHTHGGFVGERGVISTAKIPHCHNSYDKYFTGGYTIVDNRPIELWEQKAVEHNARVDT